MLVFATTGCAQVPGQLFEDVAKEGLGNMMVAWLSLEKRYPRRPEGTALEFE